MSVAILPLKTEVHAAEAFSLKLTCKQADLAQGLSIVSRAVLAHSTQPILSCILLAVDAGRLRLSATNLEIVFQVWIDAQIEKGEAVTVLPADLLTKMVGMLPNETITLTIASEEQTLRIQCANSVSTIRSPQDPREFPLIPRIDGGNPLYSFEALTLKKLIEQVAFAAAHDDTKPVLQGVFVNMGETTLTFAAADPFHIAERSVSFSQETPISPVLIPAKNLLELARFLPASGQVQMQVTPVQKHIVFCYEQGKRIEFVSRLLEGVYPTYQKQFPKTFTTKAEVTTKKLMDAFGPAMPLAKDEMKTILVTLRGACDGWTDGLITIEAEDPDVGSYIDSVPAIVTGPERAIIFPVRYLVQALEHIETPQVVFGVGEPGRPGVFTPVGEMQYRSLVMSALPPKENQ